MQEIQYAFNKFFKQFVPHVFHEGQHFLDENNEYYPRITYSNSMTDFDVSTLTTFQIWDWSYTDTNIWAVERLIAKALPVGETVLLEIPERVWYEYKNPFTGEWKEFTFDQYAEIIADLNVDWLEWEERTEGSFGVIAMTRGNPFLTASPKDEMMLRARYGTIECKYLTTI